MGWSWHQHGNLFLMGQPDVAAAIAQNKADIAEEMGLPGLVIDEGFLSAWLEIHPTQLWDPDEEALRKALESGDVLVWDKPSSPLGAKLLAKAPGLAGARARRGVISGAAGYHEILAFLLDDGTRRLS